jgi:hypothetical protein
MNDKLKETFANYENSAFFIDCCFEGLLKAGVKEKQIKWFINNHFQTQKGWDYGAIIKNVAHWQNVNFDKLNQYDFLNYKHTTHTLSNYRIVAKTMEQYIYL